MFKSLVGIVSDVVTVAVAPIEIAADLTRVVTKPMAEAAKEIADDVKEATGNKEKPHD